MFFIEKSRQEHMNYIYIYNIYIYPHPKVVGVHMFLQILKCWESSCLEETLRQIEEKTRC